MYKKGSKLGPNNYRPISLISTLLKLFTTILNIRLLKYVDAPSPETKILNDFQNGFRKGRSCEDHIFTLNSIIQYKIARKKGRLYDCFVDFAKAFDSVPHLKLWQKLREIGVPENFIQLISFIYKNATAQIKTNAGMSKKFNINRGVLQGESLSPTLFNIYLNDLIEKMDKLSGTRITLHKRTIHALLFADDIVLLSTNPVGLQKKLNALSEYAMENDLKVNTSKTQVMVFRKAGRLQKADSFTYNNQLLEIVSEYKYLGCLRLTQKILRFRNYSRCRDEVNYWREQLMLFTPWRNEDEELIHVNVLEKGKQLYDLIFANCKPYYYNRSVDDDVVHSLLEEAKQIQEFNEATDEGKRDDDEDPLSDYIVEHDYTGNKAPKVVENFMPAKLVDEGEYLKVMRRLNEKQRKFVLHILHCYKEGKITRHFLTGGAGVGKSEVIFAIVQSVLRFENQCAVHNPECCPVMVGAPTGKAAFNVFGMTLHCIFKLPPTQNAGKLCQLDSSVVNSLRVKFQQTKLFIIDEISMVSVRQLYDIDERLRQIFYTSEPFGNKSMLLVGHLRQLPPVAGRYIFSYPNHLLLGPLLQNHLWPLFSMYELTEIMRQKGDKEFCKALNNMSEGCMDYEDIKLMRSRKVTTNNVPPDDAIHLFSTNNECQIHNAKVHSKLGTMSCKSIALDKIEGKSCSRE